MSEPCPMCHTPLTPQQMVSEPFRPFCSKRCKLLDLSRWLSEDYRVPGESMGDGAVQHTDDEDL